MEGRKALFGDRPAVGAGAALDFHHGADISGTKIGCENRGISSPRNIHDAAVAQCRALRAAALDYDRLYPVSYTCA